MIMITPNTSMIIMRSRQDNGATCLNCKVDFSLEMLTTASLFSSPLPHHASPPTAPPFTFEMQAAWVSHSARPPISHSHYLYSHTLFSISPYLSPALSLSLSESFHCALAWSKTALWHCARHPGSRKHQTTKEQLAKKETDTEGQRRTCTCVYIRTCVLSVCVINKWIN